MARRRDGASACDPLNHCALNVALYGPGGRWAMTERGRHAIGQTAAGLRIGPSAIAWDGSALEFSVDELSAPWPSRLRGRVRLYPSVLPDYPPFTLDPAGRHRWWPFAPRARIEVSFQRPALNWSGDAYFDSNEGSAPLETDFIRWDWSRAAVANGATAVLYSPTGRYDRCRALALRFDGAGRYEPFPPPAPVRLPASRWWRIERRTQADGGRVTVRQTLEDTPFYARSLLHTELLKQPVTAVHESLSLDRFRRAWVQLLLPARMPRRARWPASAASAAPDR